MEAETLLSLIVSMAQCSLAAVLTGATVVYVVLTHKLAKESEKMRKAQTEPHVAVYVQPSQAASGFLDLYLHNIGLGPAYDVRLNIEPDLEYIPGRHMSDLGIVRNGWSYLAPGQRFHICYISMIHTNAFEGNEPKMNRNSRFSTRLDISICWQNSVGAAGRITSAIDFAGLENMLSVGQPIAKIESHLKSIRDELKVIARHFGYLERKRLFGNDDDEEQNNE